MKNYFLNRKLKRLERAGNDDYALILEFGASYYSTKELRLFVDRLNRENQFLVHRRGAFFKLGASATLWMAVFFLFQTLSFNPGIYVALAMAPISILLFAIGSIYLNIKYMSSEDRAGVLNIISKELEQRRKDASIL